MRRDGRFRDPRPEIAGQMVRGRHTCALKTPHRCARAASDWDLGTTASVGPSPTRTMPIDLIRGLTPSGADPGQMSLGAPLARSQARHRRSRAISPITMCISESTNVTEQWAQKTRTRPLERLTAPGATSVLKKGCMTSHYAIGYRGATLWYRVGRGQESSCTGPIGRNTNNRK